MGKHCLCDSEDEALQQNYFNPELLYRKGLLLKAL